VAKAVDRRLTVQEREAVSALNAWLLGSAQFATLVVDTHGYILYSNERADVILEQRDGLLREDGALRLTRETNQAQWRQALRRSNHAHAGTNPVVVRVDRAAGGRPLALLVITPNSARLVADLRIVLINDTSKRMSVRPEWVAALLGITPAEARVVALVAQGLSVEEISTALNVAAGTVRVHLRNVFRKLNVNRQSDLVAMVLGSGAIMYASGAQADPVGKLARSASSRR
jgi:DNA-binding CsgD family transcriptional regulator